MRADSAGVTFSLDHVGIDVDDLPAQIDFYSRAFHLKVEQQRCSRIQLHGGNARQPDRLAPRAVQARRSRPKACPR